MFGEIRNSLAELYRRDDRPWLVGYSGGKAEPLAAARRSSAKRKATGRAEWARASANETMVVSLVFDAVVAVPPDQRKKPVAILCTDTHQENPKREIRNPKPGCHSELVEESQLSHLDGADKRLNSQTPRGQGGNSNPWGNDNRALYKLYANASNGECPIQIDTSTPSCGHSRFGCWTCTVVERDKPSRTRRRCRMRQPSEGLLAFRFSLN
jgi:3'-phosphoadenosine 5'-phosphosulfate sulfotransferase (PAPS reductase)/FAD synthetase